MCLNLTLRGWVFILIKQTGWDQHVILEYAVILDMDIWLRKDQKKFFCIQDNMCFGYIMRGKNVACWHVEIGTWWRGLQLLSVERFCQVLQTTWTWTPADTPVPWSLHETAETWPFCVRCINSELTGKHVIVYLNRDPSLFVRGTQHHYLPIEFLTMFEVNHFICNSPPRTLII